MKTRFLALRNQVDPHFLFNSLNTLSLLVKTDAAKAEEYVQQLSYVFRYTLQNKDVITLEEELKFTRAYCRLMQIRYGDSLRFEYRVDERCNDCPVIPISLQTLVENAIKHNIVSKRQPLVISIFTTESSICVSNPIQPKQEPEGGESIGLANLVERYRLLWNREISIRCADGLFLVEIPIIRKKLIYESSNN
jgi:LytS/YehU family sensor histidine kinase